MGKKVSKQEKRLKGGGMGEKGCRREKQAFKGDSGGGGAKEGNGVKNQGESEVKKNRGLARKKSGG